MFVDSFELAFADDLESAEKFQVWLDTLDAQADVVGEYLMLAFTTETSTHPDKAHRTRMWKRLRALRTTHAVEWFGVKPPEDDWRWGLARRLTLEPTIEALDRCLTSRLGRFVTDFSIPQPLTGDMTRTVVGRFSSHRCLRGLDLCTWHHQTVFPLGVLSLRRLALNGFALDEGATLNPGLEALTLKEVTLTAATVHALSQPAPSLRLLTLEGSPALTQQLTLRLATRTHPVLTRLSVHVADPDTVLKYLATSGLLDGLQTLTIDGPLTDHGLEVLDAHAPRFARLETLRLDWTHCSDEAVRLVSLRLPNLSRSWRVVDASAWID